MANACVTRFSAQADGTMTRNCAAFACQLWGQSSWAILGVVWALLESSNLNAATEFPIRVSNNHRFLVDSRLRPFLYHADTPWGLFVCLTKAETQNYLGTRQRQGVRVVQVQLLAEHGPLPLTNRLGASPFLVTNDLGTPNPAYFDHVDWVIREAAQRGILVALNPIWLGCCEGGWRDTITSNGIEKCRNFGTFLGERFKEHQNVFWIQVLLLNFLKPCFLQLFQVRH